MKNQTFQNICQAVQSGELKKVEHQITHQKGRVLSCRGINFEVTTEGSRQNWAMQNCEEAS